MMMGIVYLSYPFALFKCDGNILRIKGSLSRLGYEVVDPFEDVGVGFHPSLAEKDLKLIDKADMVVVYLPFESSQTAMELFYAFLKRKKIRLYTRLEGPFFELIKGSPDVEFHRI
jgi:nucleoside 2-deoxyribosyltransferase